MAHTNISSWLSPEEYLARERQASYRSEYLNGQTFAMVGASRLHNLIVVNICAELRQQLRGRRCDVYVNDMRVRVDHTGLFTYPDVLVACEPRRFADDERDTLLNPTLIIEVLSESTADYDRGRKFAHYRSLDSLQDYLLVEQHHCQVEHFQRQPEGRWLLSEYAELDGKIVLESVGCELSLSEVYHKVL